MINGHRRLLNFASIVFGVFLPANGWTQERNVPILRKACPQLPQMTYDEDAEVLRSGCRGGLADPVQFMTLGENEANNLSIGYSIRERGDYVSNPNWSGQPPGNVYLMQRYFLHIDLHVAERFRFFGEFASSLVDGRNGGPRPAIDEEKMYLHQGFVDLDERKSANDSMTLRVGRQEVALGSENFVSTRDGRNIRRSVDGVRWTWLEGKWTVDLLAVRPTQEGVGYFRDPPDHASSFWAAYAVHPFRVLPGGNLDFYYMGLDNKSVPFDGKGTGREQRETIGTRLWGTTEHWDYNHEFTFQSGWFRSSNIRAWGVSTEHGYRFDQAILSPRFGLRAVAFSGDRNPSSHTLGTFNSIFEKGPYFSYAELFARRNLVALQPSADLKLTNSITLKVNPAFFWRESTSDGLYSIGNTVIVSGLSSNARFIAAQASAQVRWQMTRNLSMFSEYGHFFSGSFLKQSTPGKDINIWAAWIDIRY